MAVVAVATVLGGACTGDPPRPDGSSEPGRPRCEQIPGTVPDDFILTGTEDVEYEGHVGVRYAYEASDRRTLTYLMGILGPEVSEGDSFLGHRELLDGTFARFLGSGRTWFLVWDAPAPCRQNAIIGDRMNRGQFLELMRKAGVITAGGGTPTAWVAVFATAAESSDLEEETQDLIERVGRAIVASPAGCFPTLADRLGIGPNDYVLGVIAFSERDLQDAIEKADGNPVLTGAFPDLCGE